MVQTTEQLVTTDAQRYLLIYMIAVLVILTALVIVFFVFFQKRKNKLLMDKIKQQRAFDKEMQRAQTEVQEQTLKNIGWELHDNVGQLLAYANMQMNMLNAQVEEKVKPTLNATSETIKQSLQEVRALSKSLNNDVLLNMGLIDSIKNEVTRLERLKFETVNFNIVGEEKPLQDKKHQVILFRILQEFFSNSIKYSEADTLSIQLNYQPNILEITVADNGKGFDVALAEKGSGLINMKSRAELIKTSFNLTSKQGEGTKLVLNYPLV
ncbi:sensor histidine kinase [Mangrovimonas spongiae]|uniref:histidine kinase n=1 Tax=Mangrovimonas spongiae TaxID=2494697 RepID=A0A428K1G5_9FLAO|nr:histidine kinase [Mangrovimonas spongiae]RSK40228.1 histidine kinase [Mangrovimonas spongiae]